MGIGQLRKTIIKRRKSMKDGINLNAALVDYKKKELGFTVKDALQNVLGSTQAENGEDAVKSWRLAMKITDANDLSGLSTDERALLLNKVRKSTIYLPLVQGCLIDMLE